MGESLAPEQAQVVAEEARARRGANAFRLVDYLSDRPDALSLPTSDCPACVVRLLAALTTIGHGDKVALVPCGWGGPGRGDGRAGGLVRAAVPQGIRSPGACPKPAVLIPLPASVSRGDQLDNTHAYASRHPGRCLVIPDDEALTDGTKLAEACVRLAAASGDTQEPNRTEIHRAARLVATEAWPWPGLGARAPSSAQPSWCPYIDRISLSVSPRW